MTNKVPEATDVQNDRDYCRYLEGHSNTAIGLLLLLAGLDSIYTALDKEEEHDNFDSSEQP